LAENYPRQIDFEKVINFRDIGGYRARGGRTVAWRRLFRSAELRHLSENDLARLRGEIGLTSVLDLRNSYEVEHQGRGLLGGAGFKYYNVPFISGDGESENKLPSYEGFHSMGEFYVYLIRQSGFNRQVLAALEIVAEPENHPLVFHCAAGKDRTGILAAVILGALGVADADIQQDYCLSASHMVMVRNRLKNAPKLSANVPELPDFAWEATPESMDLLLAALRREYGTMKDYLSAHGAAPSLLKHLRIALLT
jgi:protein-tyrosine phosphatase